MPNLGPTELILILVIVIVIFGAGKLANLGGALGKGIKDFRGAVKEGGTEDEGAENEAEAAEETEVNSEVGVKAAELADRLISQEEQRERYRERRVPAEATNEQGEGANEDENAR